MTEPVVDLTAKLQRQKNDRRFAGHLKRVYDINPGDKRDAINRKLKMVAMDGGAAIKAYDPDIHAPQDEIEANQMYTQQVIEVSQLVLEMMDQLCCEPGHQLYNGVPNNNMFLSVMHTVLCIAFADHGGVKELHRYCLFMSACTYGIEPEAKHVVNMFRSIVENMSQMDEHFYNSPDGEYVRAMRDDPSYVSFMNNARAAAYRKFADSLNRVADDIGTMDGKEPPVA